jgi:hypothetical protein
MAAQLDIPYLTDEQMKAARQAFKQTYGWSSYGPGGVPQPATLQEIAKFQATIQVIVQVDGQTLRRPLSSGSSSNVIRKAEVAARVGDILIFP